MEVNVYQNTAEILRFFLSPFSGYFREPLGCYRPLAEELSSFMLSSRVSPSLYSHQLSHCSLFISLSLVINCNIFMRYYETILWPPFCGLCEKEIFKFVIVKDIASQTHCS